MTPIRLGTRKSALAKAQAMWVALRLRSAFPDTPIELVYITTSGDVRSATPESTAPPEPLDPQGGLKALFTKEIEQALLDQQIDLAIHSLKDMAADLLPGVRLAAVPPREDVRDVWIGKNGKPFNVIADGATVATGAIRRQAQLRYLKPNLNVVPIRGNVDTRLRKLAESEFDGMILALAGLKRLGRELEATEIFSTEMMLPAVGQGALGIESRVDDAKVQKFVDALNHSPSYSAALAERNFLKTLGGSCQTPIAAHAELNGDQLRLTGLVIHPSGSPHHKGVEEGAVSEAEGVGERLAKKLLQQGADKILS